RPLQALQVVAEPEHRRTLIRRVRPDALEHRGPVVQRVREHMDLGVRPVHQLTVHPDLLGYLHASTPLPLVSGPVADLSRLLIAWSTRGVSSPRARAAHARVRCRRPPNAPYGT